MEGTGVGGGPRPAAKEGHDLPGTGGMQAAKATPGCTEEEQSPTPPSHTHTVQGTLTGWRKKTKSKTRVSPATSVCLVEAKKSVALVTWWMLSSTLRVSFQGSCAETDSGRGAAEDGWVGQERGAAPASRVSSVQGSCRQKAGGRAAAGDRRRGGRGSEAHTQQWSPLGGSRVKGVGWYCTQTGALHTNNNPTQAGAQQGSAHHAHVAIHQQIPAAVVVPGGERGRGADHTSGARQKQGRCSSGAGRA